MRVLPIVLTVALLGAAAALVYYLWPHTPPPPPPPAQVQASAAPPAEAPAHFPAPQAEKGAEQPLPALNASDPELHKALGGLLGSETLRKFFNVDDFVRRVVATVDNLPRKTYSQRLSPVKPVGGMLSTTGGEGDLFLSPDNAMRYTPYVHLAQRLDAKKVVAIYAHFYPLFQQAYVELGYPNGYFNDRLVQVIDHLLDTPEVRGPIRLTVPHVLYQYADPDLESRSAGQKLLIRIGADNAAIVKAKLREIRRELTGQMPKQ